MPTVIEMARVVAREYLQNISVYDVQSIVDCSTDEAEQIVHLIQLLGEQVEI